MSNSGGVRADLAAGPLTYGRFYEAMPFDNRLVEIRLTGAQLRKVFENNFGQTEVSIPISGIRVSGRCEAGEKARLQQNLEDQFKKFEGGY